MSPVAGERALRKAVDAFLFEGALRSVVGADMVLQTEQDRYLLRNGKCIAASLDDAEGAVLVGWLLSAERTSAVGAWWRRGARAVLLRNERVIVTQKSTFLDVGGTRVKDGFSTQEARFVVGHASPDSCAPPPPSSNPPQNDFPLPDLYDSMGEEDEAHPDARTLPREVRAEA